MAKNKFINNIYITRPVDKNLKPVPGNVLTQYFSFESIKVRQDKWDKDHENVTRKRRGNHGYSPTGWIPEFISQFMDAHGYSEYTNLVNVDSVTPEDAKQIRKTVYNRLENMLKNIRTDMRNNRKWGYSNYYQKRLTSTHGHKVPKKKDNEEAVVETKGRIAVGGETETAASEQPGTVAAETRQDPSAREPEQLEIAFDSCPEQDGASGKNPNYDPDKNEFTPTEQKPKKPEDNPNGTDTTELLDKRPAIDKILGIVKDCRGEIKSIKTALSTIMAFSEWICSFPGFETNKNEGTKENETGNQHQA